MGFPNDIDSDFINILKRYIEITAHRQPLQRDLEIERAMQELERDRILENSPWLPVYLSPHKKSLKPNIALFTKANVEHNNAENLLASLQDKPFFESLSNELLKYNEAFVFHGTIKVKSGAVKITATHRQLIKLGQLNALIYLLAKNGDFICTHCRMDTVTREDKQKAFAIHDIASKEFEQLYNLSHVLYCKDVSSYIANLTLSAKCNFKPLSSELKASGDNWHIDYVMEEDLDRRSETRYVIDKSASIKMGLLSSIDAKVADLSASGMRLLVAPNSELQKDIR